MRSLVSRQTLSEPGARTDAKGPQIHGIDDVFAADDGMDGHRDDHRTELAHLLDQSAADLLQLIAARPLRIHRQLEIAAKGRDEAHGQVHGIGELVRQAQSLEGDPVQRRVERIGDQDGHDGDAEHAHQLADGEEGALDGDLQGWASSPGCEKDALNSRIRCSCL